MNIFFDTDFTVVGVDGKLRPYTREVFESLVADGHTVYMWSGARVPWDIVNVFQLDHLVKHCYFKPIDDHVEQVRLLSIPDVHFCVDDNVGSVEVFGGYVVPPYIYTDQPDDHMLRAYRAFIAQFGGEPRL